MPTDAISFDNYEATLASLKQSLDAELDDKNFVRDSVIQRFEICIEQSWKILRRYLKIVYSKDENATREIFRLADRYEIIDDANIWIDYLNARNETSHTYDENIAMRIYDLAHKLHDDAEKLLKAMKDGYARHNG
jgi:nucleotidyltransferase substrate binding protein (TIGR01987 family)